ncbi:hypothetical protein FHG87_009344 [Trinorchestia longiramus]|nr:hypothetical protein FHG87_009344 [Trinorchestia longiramus]
MRHFGLLRRQILRTDGEPSVCARRPFQLSHVRRILSQVGSSSHYPVNKFPRNCVYITLQVTTLQDLLISSCSFVMIGSHRVLDIQLRMCREI